MPFSNEVKALIIPV